MKSQGIDWAMLWFGSGGMVHPVSCWMYHAATSLLTVLFVGITTFVI